MSVAFKQMFDTNLPVLSTLYQLSYFYKSKKSTLFKPVSSPPLQFPQKATQLSTTYKITLTSISYNFSLFFLLKRVPNKTFCYTWLGVKKV